MVLAFASWPRIQMLLFILMLFLSRWALCSIYWLILESSSTPSQVERRQCWLVSLVPIINTAPSTPMHAHTHKYFHILGILPHPDRRKTAQAADLMALNPVRRSQSSFDWLIQWTLGHQIQVTVSMVSTLVHVIFSRISFYLLSFLLVKFQKHFPSRELNK